MKIRWARAARKHRITRDRALYVVQNALVTTTISAERADRTLHLGADREGILLEVVSVPTDDGIMIIHAMPMRPRYRSLL